METGWCSVSGPLVPSSRAHVLPFLSTGNLLGHLYSEQNSPVDWVTHEIFVGQPHAPGRGEGGQETEDLHERGARRCPGQGPVMRAAPSAARPCARFLYWGCGCEGARDSSDLATCPHAATEVMPWPQSGRNWVAARPLGTTPSPFSRQLRASLFYPRLIRQKKDEQYILFGVLNIQCSNGLVR